MAWNASLRVEDRDDNNLEKQPQGRLSASVEGESAVLELVGSCFTDASRREQGHYPHFVDWQTQAQEAHLTD